MSIVPCVHLCLNLFSTPPLCVSTVVFTPHCVSQLVFPPPLCPDCQGPRTPRPGPFVTSNIEPMLKHMASTDQSPPYLTLGAPLTLALLTVGHTFLRGVWQVPFAVKLMCVRVCAVCPPVVQATS